MDLRDFIKKALTDIVGGVQDAQLEVPKNTVVPKVRDSYKAVENGVSKLQAIEFEVSVRVDENKASEAKLNVVAALVGAGVKGSSDSSEGHAANLKFKIPVAFPQSKSDAE